VRAVCKDEVGDPNVTEQRLFGRWSTALIRERELRHGPKWPTESCTGGWGSARSNRVRARRVAFEITARLGHAKAAEREQRAARRERNRTRRVHARGASGLSTPGNAGRPA
jgi:hypothetical protein